MPVNLALPEIKKGGFDLDTIMKIASLMNSVHESSAKYGTPDVPGKMVKGTPGSPEFGTQPPLNVPMAPSPTLSPTPSRGNFAPVLSMQAMEAEAERRQRMVGGFDPLLGIDRGTGKSANSEGPLYPGQPTLPAQVASPAEIATGTQWDQTYRPAVEGTPDRIVGGKKGKLGSIEMEKRAWAFKAIQETDNISEDVRKAATSVMATEPDYEVALNKLNGILQKKDTVTLSEPIARMWNLMTVYKKGEAPFYNAGDKMSADEFAKTNSVFSTWAYSKTADANEATRKMNAVRYLKSLEDLKAAKSAAGIVADIEQKVKSGNTADPYAPTPDPLMQDIPSTVSNALAPGGTGSEMDFGGSTYQKQRDGSIRKIR